MDPFTVLEEALSAQGGRKELTGEPGSWAAMLPEEVGGGSVAADVPAADALAGGAAAAAETGKPAAGGAVAVDADAVLQQLKQLSTMKLIQRALAAGVPELSVDGAAESAEPKAALANLLIGAVRANEGQQDEL